MRTIKLIQIAIPTILCTFAAACAAGPIDELDTNGDEIGGTIGDPEPIAFRWAEVQCLETNAGAVGVARAEGSTAWNYVLHADELEDRVVSGNLVPVASWLEDSCSSDSTPEGWSDVRCYYTPASGTSGCFIGDGDWYTVAVPSCHATYAELANSSVAAWGENGCDAPDIGPWLDVRCAQSGELCVSMAEDYVVFARSACWVEDSEHLDLALCR